MDHGYALATRWGPRKEDAVRCASRLHQLFQILGRTALGTSGWRWITRQNEEVEIDTSDVIVLENCLLDGRLTERENGGPIVEFAGYSVDFTFAQDHPDPWRERFTLRVRCGAYQPHGRNFVGNGCTLQIPSDGPLADKLLTVPALVPLLVGVIQTWEAREAVVTLDDFRVQFRRLRPFGAEVGWLTYLPIVRNALPRLPEAVTVSAPEDAASVIILSGRRFVAADAARAFEVADALASAGLLNAAPWELTAPLISPELLDRIRRRDFDP